MQSVNFLAYAGLDAHKETLAVAIASPERLGEVRYYGTISNEPQAVRRLFQNLLGIYACTEPCGFGLYHLLTTTNVECLVIAPSHIPKSTTDHIKIDHRDAVSLAKFLATSEDTAYYRFPSTP